MMLPCQMLIRAITRADLITTSSLIVSERMLENKDSLLILVNYPICTLSVLAIAELKGMLGIGRGCLHRGME